MTNQVVAQVDGASMFAADPKKPIGKISFGLLYNSWRFLGDVMLLLSVNNVFDLTLLRR